MHLLLSTPPTSEEIEILKHIDLEKIAIVFDQYLSDRPVESFAQLIQSFLNVSPEVELR